MFTAFFFSLPESRMDYLLDQDIEMELLLAIAFEDDIMTQDVQQLDENTTTIPESQPPNTEAATAADSAAFQTMWWHQSNCLKTNIPLGMKIYY